MIKFIKYQTKNTSQSSHPSVIANHSSCTHDWTGAEPKTSHGLFLAMRTGGVASLRRVGTPVTGQQAVDLDGQHESLHVFNSWLALVRHR